jgi:hypothetical protein
MVKLSVNVINDNGLNKVEELRNAIGTSYLKLNWLALVSVVMLSTADENGVTKIQPSLTWNRFFYYFPQ